MMEYYRNIGGGKAKVTAPKRENPNLSILQAKMENNELQ